MQGVPSGAGNATAGPAEPVPFPFVHTLAPEVLAWATLLYLGLPVVGLVCMAFSSRCCELVCTLCPDLTSEPHKPAAPYPVKTVDIVPPPAAEPARPVQVELTPVAISAVPKPRLWRLGDGFYDMTEFMPQHPGGSLVLEQTMGTEISALFHSHHLTSLPEKVLAKYRVHNVSPEAAAAIPPCDYTFGPGGFFHTLKQRVIALNMRDPSRADATYARRVYAMFTLCVLTWLACCFMPMGIVVCAIAFVNSALRLVVTGIGHESIHGRVNNRVTWEFFNMMMLFPSNEWHLEHVTMHHPDTKRVGLDPDEILDPFRLCSAVAWQPHHMLQAPLQLVLVFASLISFIDKHLINSGYRLKGAVYLLLFHLLPLFTRPASEACLLMFLSVGMSNMITVFCFHLSHINEANAKAYNESFHKGIDWGAHQILTTANYLGSWTVFFGVTGMLEMQIEHHLFPGLSYANQLRIKPIVEMTCKEFGLPYYEYSTAFTGIAAHLFTMHKYGRRPE